MIENVKNAVRKGKWIARCVAGKDLFQRRQVRRPATILGGRSASGYGAWTVHAEPLSSASIIYSAGVGDDISFDLALIEQFGAVVHAFDPTPQSHEWLQRQTLPDLFRLHKYGIASYDGTASFAIHENPDFVLGTMLEVEDFKPVGLEVQVRRLSTLMPMLGHSHIDLLKMDIEGSEYGVIDDLVQSGIEVRQLLVEFHHRFPQISTETTRKAIEQLNAAGFRIFHISPTGEEYSFVRV